MPLAVCSTLVALLSASDAVFEFCVTCVFSPLAVCSTLVALESASVAVFEF